MGDLTLPASVSVVIPSLHGGSKLLEAVERILADARTETEVVVADNGLPRAVAGELTETGARVVPMGANRGFGAAVNRAAAASSGDVLVLFNDDAVPCEGFVESLVAPLGHPTVMAAGVLLPEATPDLIETAGIVVDAVLSPYDHLAGHRVAVLEQMPRPSPPLGPCGGAAAYDRRVFLDAGGFDENLFAYGEDFDLALRLRRAGATCALATDARAVHAGSGTLGYHSLPKANLVGYARGYLLRKYGVLRSPVAGTRAIATEAAASLLLARRHRSLSPARARIRGWRDCNERAPRFDRSYATVGLLDGFRSRYARSVRPVAGGEP